MRALSCVGRRSWFLPTPKGHIKPCLFVVVKIVMDTEDKSRENAQEDPNPKLLSGTCDYTG